MHSPRGASASSVVKVACNSVREGHDPVFVTFFHEALMGLTEAVARDVLFSVMRASGWQKGTFVNEVP